MLDDETPHVACVVHAVIPTLGKPEVVSTTLTDSAGRYEFKNLLPGRYQVRCYTLNGYVYYGSESTVLEIAPGKTLRNIDFRIAPFKKGTWEIAIWPCRHYKNVGGIIVDAGVHRRSMAT